MSSPHRQTYRIEQNVRALSDDEKATVAARCKESRAVAYRKEMRGENGLLLAAIAACGAAIAGLWKLPGAFFGVLLMVTLVVCGLLFLTAHLNAEQRVRAMRSVWDSAEGTTWKVCETLVAARTFIATVSGDEDYMEWWLFEIPGNDWYFVDPSMFPKEIEPRDEIRIVSLHPNGPQLSVTSHGEPLQRRGAPDDDYAKAMDLGFVWHPEPLAARGSVSEASLPAWVRD